MLLEVLPSQLVSSGEVLDGRGYRPPRVGWATYRGRRPYSPKHFFSGSVPTKFLENLQALVRPYQGSGYAYSTNLDEVISQKLAQECLLEKTPKTRCVYLSSPPHNSPTTYDFQREKTVGMHLDNFQATTEGLIKADMRFLLNIGSSARHFLLSNVTSSSICDQIRGESRLNPSQIVAKTILEEPAQIYRFRMEPGVYYLARTEHFAHDGMSPQADRDHVLTFRTQIDEVG